MKSKEEVKKEIDIQKEKDQKLRDKQLVVENEIKEIKDQK